MIFPEIETKVSLGKLLACENLDRETILSQLVVHDERIGVLGYNSGENCFSYAFPTSERFTDFLMQMRHLVNYTIIDCNIDVMYRPTAKSLIGADNVLYLISCDINGLVFHQSQESILLSEQYGYNNFMRYLTITGKFIQDEENMRNAITQVNGIIPYCDSLSELWNQGKALTPVQDVSYNKAISNLADTLMEV